ncbi:MAG: D-alanyl-D-alanine carboxypeptidase [Fibrobacteria bacterium]|nr:D-alanyl-D-alanine carboxypeptidase [Fibrobacteria bacterium]
MELDSLHASLYAPDGGSLGAYVVRTRDSALVWSHQPDRRTLPASTMKVLTAAAALEDLGPEYRWRTRIWSQGAIVGGTLKGDLILEGGGDPTLGSDGSSMSPLVAAVSRAGIRKVSGRLIAFDPLVGRGLDVWPQGWSIGNAQDGYGAPVAGLNWGQNRGRHRSIHEPRLLALQALRSALESKKITVTGSDTTLWVRGDTIPDSRKWNLLGKTSSPRLGDVLRSCLVHSVNPYAEASVLAMGVRRPFRNLAPRDNGIRRFRQVLTLLGVSPSVHVDDGSGLSRYDMVTARAMAELLRRDQGKEPGLRVSDLMAVGGQGTLRRRFGGLPAQEWVTAKTGTLDGTSTLVGLLRVPGRDTLAFALLCSGYRGGASRVRFFQDRMIMAMAGIAPAEIPLGEDSTEAPDEEPSSLEVDSLPEPSPRDSTPSLPTPPSPPVKDSVRADSTRIRDTVVAPAPDSSVVPGTDTLPSPVAPGTDTLPAPVVSVQLISFQIDSSARDSTSSHLVSIEIDPGSPVDSTAASRNDSTGRGQDSTQPPRLRTPSDSDSSHTLLPSLDSLQASSPPSPTVDSGAKSDSLPGHEPPGGEGALGDSSSWIPEGLEIRDSSASPAGVDSLPSLPPAASSPPGTVSRDSSGGTESPVDRPPPPPRECGCPRRHQCFRPPLPRGFDRFSHGSPSRPPGAPDHLNNPAAI